MPETHLTVGDELDPGLLARDARDLATDLALQHAVDIDVQITSLDTPDRMKFREVSKKDGLKAALAWRESRFAK